MDYVQKFFRKSQVSKAGIAIAFDALIKDCTLAMTQTWKNMRKLN